MANQFTQLIDPQSGTANQSREQTHKSIRLLHVLARGILPGSSISLVVFFMAFVCLFLCFFVVFGLCWLV